ncbi:MAG: hypothetical protein J6U54_10190 [Clostridiales bacterium]|nr:hypothetical protein [Clostridiales bacterium]
MKMGTVSNSIFHALGKNRGQVKISMDDAKWHEAAMDALGHMSKPEDWGVIRDRYFEKCNNMSALIGFAVGVSMVCVVAKVRKDIKERDEHAK